MKPTTFISMLVAGLCTSADASPTDPAALMNTTRQANRPVGYGAGTTGGGSAAATTVTSCAQLKSAVSAQGAKVVRVNGLLANCGTLRVTSDTSIVGVGAGSGASGTGFRIKDATNVIIQNMKIGPPPAGADAIDVETSTQIWIDHCELQSVGLTGGKDDYDGLFDAKRGSDNLEVSYTKFRDHFKASISSPSPEFANEKGKRRANTQKKGSLIGHSDSNAAQDTGKLRITYHHNSFTNIGSRLPSLRFGTGHVFNSVFTSCPTSGINSRMGAQVLVENNVFHSVKRAIATNLDSDAPGCAADVGNVFSGGSTTEITQTCTPRLPYNYTLESTNGLAAAIEARAGTGKI